MPEFEPINKIEEEDTDMDVKDEPQAEEEDGGPVQDIKKEANEDAPASAKKGKAAATPRKRGRKPAGDKAGEDGDDNTTPTKKPRATPKKGTPKAPGEKKSEARPIPTSYEQAGPEDRMLLRMKDVEGKPWAEIREAWEAMTGEKVGGSTLAGRYTRIKANLVSFKEEDEERLLKFKKEIEDKFENEKWHRVAEAIENAGGDKYPPAALMKKFKELSKKMTDVNLESN